MTHFEDDDFTPEDIINAGQSAESARADIDDAMRSVDPEIQEQMAETQLLVRSTGFHILEKLRVEGIAEANELKDMLDEIDPTVEPLFADMFAVASKLEDEMYGAEDLEERQKLKRVGGLAHAVAAMAVAKAGSSIPNSASMLEYAVEQIEILDVEPTARTVLFQIAAEA